MLIDAINLLTGTILEAVICIIGSGPAGLSLATELDAAGISTLLLEAGGLGPEPDDAGFVDGETAGDPFCALGITRARGLGGTANLWDTRWDPATTGFRGGPLDPIDFERREWVPMSGWPFGRRELDPFYARAHEFSRFGPFEYEPRHWETDSARALRFPDGAFETRMWLFGAQRTILGERRAALERSPRARIVTHAGVVELDADPGGSGIRSVR
ncbi:MAG: FAD-dependent monooxygenase, partial [Gemmatimonadota bacterium]